MFTHTVFSVQFHSYLFVRVSPRVVDEASNKWNFGNCSVAIFESQSFDDELQISPVHLDGNAGEEVVCGPLVTNKGTF